MPKPHALTGPMKHKCHAKRGLCPSPSYGLTGSRGTMCTPLHPPTHRPTHPPKTLTQVANLKINIGCNSAKKNLWDDPVRPVRSVDELVARRADPSLPSRGAACTARAANCIFDGGSIECRGWGRRASHPIMIYLQISDTVYHGTALLMIGLKEFERPT